MNCKSNAGETIGKDDKEDSLNIFYQSLIKLGNGFIDVFNAFSGLVADTFFKADPKKSDVKSYFTSLCEKLKSTKEKLGNLSNGNEKGANGNEKGDGADSKSGDAVGSVVGEVSKWLEEMIKAAEEAIVGATGDGTKIGESANNGAAADADSVKNIAKGMKGIVDAAGTAAGKKDDVLKDVKAAGAADAETGKLFGTGGAGDAADDIKKAAEAVSSVSGEQILKAIVDAAAGKEGEQNGQAPNAARNPIAAAIGDGAGADFHNDMKKKDKVAAEAIVGATGGDTKIGESAANGAAADANSVKNIAKGMKGIVDAAGTAAGKKEDVLKDVKAAGEADQETGKLFGTAGAAANDNDIKKAAAAVSSVSGEQILKAIVDAAAGKEGEQDGAAPGAAKNPIAAAIGNGNGADFGVADMKKKDKVAAALVLRGLAKDGKFSAAANDANVKSAVENAVGKKEGVLKDVQDAGDGAAAEAGKLFGTGAGGGDAADADIKKAAEAVSSVSGEQILKAIVDAAAGGEQDGKAPNAAKNPIAAAIGAGAGAS
ncbi:variable large family protein (plasmid) [Borreliella burgdorferi]|uniref:variable large family protein n=1 Tax=Borreliella burgdorferi TaxID=139 RepID=UPI00346269E3